MKFPSIAYYKRVYNRYGLRAILFLIRSKFKSDKEKDIRIKGIKGPITLSNFKYDVTTLFQIFFAEEYNVNLKTEPEFIIDCGANIGLSAVYFANKYPTAKIVAIEPDTNNFEFLKRNTAHYPNVVCLQKAIWPVKASLRIADPGRGNWGLQTKIADNVAANTVEGITLDEVMDEFGIDEIDLLKIDIEGAEKELFTSGYENWLSKTKVMAIELHDFLDSTISPVFYKAMESYKFKTYGLGENLICERE